VRRNNTKTEKNQSRFFPFSFFLGVGADRFAAGLAVGAAARSLVVIKNVKKPTEIFNKEIPNQKVRSC